MPKKKITIAQKTILRTWYDAHKEWPYPDRQKKEQLAKECGGGMTRLRVQSWFGNERSKRNECRANEGNTDKYQLKYEKLELENAELKKKIVQETKVSSDKKEGAWTFVKAKNKPNPPPTVPSSTITPCFSITLPHNNNYVCKWCKKRGGEADSHWMQRCPLNPHPPDWNTTKKDKQCRYDTVVGGCTRSDCYYSHKNK